MSERAIVYSSEIEMESARKYVNCGVRSRMKIFFIIISTITRTINMEDIKLEIMKLVLY